MTTKGEKWFEEQLKSLEGDFEFRLEGHILDFTRKICKVMESKNVTRAELARKMGVSKAYITEILTGMPNLTFESLLKVADALETKLAVDLIDPARAEALTGSMQCWTTLEALASATIRQRIGQHDSKTDSRKEVVELADAA